MQDGEWEEVELDIDSGSIEIVIDANTLTHVKVVEGPAVERSQVANNFKIQNLGKNQVKHLRKEEF